MTTASLHRLKSLLCAAVCRRSPTTKLKAPVKGRQKTPCKQSKTKPFCVHFVRVFAPPTVARVHSLSDSLAQSSRVCARSPAGRPRPHRSAARNVHGRCTLSVTARGAPRNAAENQACAIAWSSQKPSCSSGNIQHHRFFHINNVKHISIGWWCSCRTCTLSRTRHKPIIFCVRAGGVSTRSR